jgi:uncharacterized membrane-anchored protein
MRRRGCLPRGFTGAESAWRSGCLILRGQHGEKVVRSEELHGLRSPQHRASANALAAILAVACSAMLWGSRSYTVIAEWERN